MLWCGSQVHQFFDVESKGQIHPEIRPIDDVMLESGSESFHSFMSSAPVSRLKRSKVMQEVVNRFRQLANKASRESQGHPNIAGNSIQRRQTSSVRTCCARVRCLLSIDVLPRQDSHGSQSFGVPYCYLLWHGTLDSARIMSTPCSESLIQRMRKLEKRC